MATAARAATAKRDRMVVFLLFQVVLESFTTKDFILFKFVRIKS